MGQPACSKKKYLSFDQMAGPYICRSFCHNPSSGGEDDLEKIHQKLPPKTAILPLLLQLFFRLKHPLPLQFPLRPPIKGFFNSLWKPIWRTITRTRPHLPLQSKQSFESNHQRLSSPTFIMEILTWTATVFVSNVRTTLIPSELMSLTIFHSLPHSPVGQSYNTDININVALKGPR